MARNSRCQICNKVGRYEPLGNEMYKFCMIHNLMIEDNPDRFIDDVRIRIKNATPNEIVELEKMIKAIENI